MKFLSLLVIGSAMMMIGGCASRDSGTTSAVTADSAAAVAGDGESYVALGSNIPKKGARRAEDKTLSLQQMENDRNNNNSAINSAR